MNPVSVRYKGRKIKSPKSISKEQYKVPFKHINVRKDISKWT